MKRLLRKHGLSLALFGIFALVQTGLSLVDNQQHNARSIETQSRVAARQ